jgi:hypothetical protein
MVLKLLYLPYNMGMNKKRTLIFGDVHGCLDELKALLETLLYDASLDRLIFVGDLINKGPSSYEVLKFVHQLGAEVVVGNHELSLLKYIKTGCDGQFPVWDNLLNEMGSDRETLLSWISSWPYFIEEDEFIVVHGGLPPGQQPAQVAPEILTKIRTWDGEGLDVKNKDNPAWHELYQGKKLVVYGHWALQGLMEKELTIGLDSGCVYGRELSALILPEKRVVQVAAKRCYQSVK